MAAKSLGELFDRIQEHAFRQIPSTKLQTTNLYLDRRIREPGEQLGPSRQEIVVERPSVLVFVDDEPRANFAHACRYLLYDPETAQLHREVPARFPPFLERIPESLIAKRNRIPVSTTRSTPPTARSTAARRTATCRP